MVKWADWTQCFFRSVCLLCVAPMYRRGHLVWYESLLNRSVHISLSEQVHLFSTDKKMVWSFFLQHCGQFLCGEEGVRALCVYLVMTALFPPTTLSHHYVLKRTDSVGLMEVDMEMVGAESVSLIVICTQILLLSFETGTLWCRAHWKASESTEIQRDCWWSNFERHPL